MAHRSQLVGLGFSDEALRHRINRGSLHPVLPLVLAIGHPTLTPLAAQTAALVDAPWAGPQLVVEADG